MAAAGDQVAAERGDVGVDLPVEAGAAGPFDEFGDVVGVKTLFGTALGDGQGFLVDEGIGFASAHFVGEDFVVEAGEDRVIGRNALDVAL